MEDSQHLSAVKEYYVRIDSGRPDVLELFAPDFEFYYPKFGIGIGENELMEFGEGLRGSLRAITHDKASLTFIETPSAIVVEGQSSGTDQHGQDWTGGKTPGGRFCSVFLFEGALIKRMSVYLDPDYTGRNKEGFRWGMERRW